MSASRLAPRLVGSNSPIRGNTVKRFVGARVCSARGCKTRLSQYNPSDRCWPHQNVKQSRNRARHKEPDEESA